MYTLKLTDDEVVILRLALRAFDESEIEDDFEDAAEKCDSIMDKLMGLGV